MRKIILSLMLFALIIVPCSAMADEYSQIQKFGIFRRYEANGTVRLSGSNPDYSGVTGYSDTGSFFGAKLTSSYRDGQDLPDGFLFTSKDRREIVPTPTEGSSLVCYIGNDGTAKLAGSRIRWTLTDYAGAMTVSTDVAAASSGVDIGSIVPYVRLMHDGNDSKISRVLVYFVQSGDTKPVSVSGVRYVRVAIDGSEYIFNEYDDYSRGVPVFHVIDTELDDQEDFTIYLEYFTKDAAYFWRFAHELPDDSNIIWSNGSYISISEGSSDTITITLSGDMEFTDIFAGSSDIITISYDVASDSYGHDAVSVTVSGDKAGLTALHLLYSMDNQEYSSMIIVNVPGSEYSADVLGYSSKVSMIEGRPEYGAISTTFTLGLPVDDGYMTLDGLSSWPDGSYDIDIYSLDFVPYVELVREGHKVTNIKWSFVNLSDDSEVSSPDIQNLYVWVNTDAIYFSYTADSIDYNWSFVPMSPEDGIIQSIDDILEYEPLTITLSSDGSEISIDVKLSFDADYSVDVRVGNTDIISAEISEVSPDENGGYTHAITITGKSEGITTLSIMFYVSGSPDSYVCAGSYLVQVVSGDSGKWSLVPVYSSEAWFMEGKPYYYSNDASISPDFELRYSGFLEIQTDTLSSQDTYGTISSLDGTISFTVSGDASYDAQSLDIGYIICSVSYDENASIDAKIMDVRSGRFKLSVDVVSVDWTPSEAMQAGESFSVILEVPEYTVRSSLEQYNTYIPHVELVKDGLNVTGITWRFADSNDNEASADTIANVTGAKLKYVTKDFKSEYYYGVSGDIALAFPVMSSEFLRCDFTFTEDGTEYHWTFKNVHSGGIEDSEFYIWDISSPDFPIVMQSGTSQDISVVISNYPYSNGSSGVKAFSSSSILDVAISNDYPDSGSGNITLNVTVTLTANAPGIATFMLVTDTNLQAAEREVWIYDSDGHVPGLSETLSVDEIIALMSEGYDSSNDDDDSDGRVKPEGTGRYTNSDIIIENGEIITFSGDEASFDELSVKPKFAVPQDPQDGAYLSMWDYVEELDLDDVMLIEDENLTASRDAYTVFEALKDILISMDTPQLLAIVLPSISIDEAGYYTFSISVDNIPYDTNIFWYSQVPQSVSTQAAARNVKASGFEFTGNEISPDSALSSDKQIFMNSDGTLTDVTLSQDEGTINVSVYWKSGSYDPIITAQATSNDVALFTVTTESEEPKPEPDPTPDPEPDPEPDPKPDPTPTPTPSPDPESGDESGDEEPETDTLTVTITKATISNGTLGKSYRDNLTADHAGVKWVMTSGSLPEGLRLGAYTGVISGIPKEAGTFAFNVSATLGSASDYAEISLTIDEPAITEQESPDPSPDIPAQPEGSSKDIKPATPDGGTKSSDNSGNVIIPSGDNTYIPSNTTLLRATDEVKSVMPDYPRIDVQFMAKTIRSILREKNSSIPEYIDVARLPNSILSSARGIDDVSDEDLANIQLSQKPVLILPIMTPDNTAIYVFGVRLVNMNVGDDVFMYLMPESIAESFTASEAGGTVCVVLDDYGKQVDTVPSSRHVNVAAYLRSDYTFAPIIATGDETAPEVVPASDKPEPREAATASNAGSSSGGCESGLGAMSLALAFMMTRRKR